MVLAQKHKRSRVLTDCSLLKGGHSVVDLFQEINHIYDQLVGTPFREAIVLPADPTAAELVRFWETACKNRGLNVEIFLTRQAAIASLLD